jgi:hypothetical protein
MVGAGDDASVAFLLSAGADTEMRNIANQTACGIASKWGRTATQQLLIGAGACPAPEESGGALCTKPLKHARAAGAAASAPRRTKPPRDGTGLPIQATRAENKGAGGSGWKEQADVRLEWELEKERDAQEWIAQLVASQERHLTQYHMIKELEQELLDTQRRLARAEQMLDVCQADLSEETRQLLDDYHRRLREACASSSSSSSPPPPPSPSSSVPMQGCESCEVEFHSGDSAHGGGKEGADDASGLVLHAGRMPSAQVHHPRIRPDLCPYLRLTPSPPSLPSFLVGGGGACVLAAGTRMQRQSADQNAGASLEGIWMCLAALGRPAHECTHAAAAARQMR